MVEEGEGRDGVSINQLTKGACSVDDARNRGPRISVMGVFPLLDR